jgi:hypothetical protein
MIDGDDINVLSTKPLNARRAASTENNWSLPAEIPAQGGPVAVEESSAVEEIESSAGVDTLSSTTKTVAPASPSSSASKENEHLIILSLVGLLGFIIVFSLGKRSGSSLGDKNPSGGRKSEVRWRSSCVHDQSEVESDAEMHGQRRTINSRRGILRPHFVETSVEVRESVNQNESVPESSDFDTDTDDDDLVSSLPDPFVFPANIVPGCAAPAPTC